MGSQQKINLENKQLDWVVYESWIFSNLVNFLIPFLLLKAKYTHGIKS